MGGMETYCIRLTEELSKTNSLDVMALSGRLGGAPPSALQIISFGIGTAWRLLFLKFVPIVHLGDMSLWPLGWIAKIRHKRSKIIISAHGSDVSFAKRGGILAALYGVYLKLGSKLMRDCKVIANSSWVADLSAQHGYKDVHTVYLATDIKLETSVGGHNGKLFFAGRILKSKGVSHFVRTVLERMENPPMLRVAGTVWDKTEGQILKSKHVEYLGVLDQQTLAREYQNAMCVIVPSLSAEGFGLVAVEAAAAGGVVLGADHSGLAEACDGSGGFKAPIDEPDVWIETLERIQSWNLEERQEFITQRQPTAQEFYSWARVAKQTQDIYTV